MRRVRVPPSRRVRMHSLRSRTRTRCASPPQLPLLHLGRMFDAQGSAAEAVVIKPDLAMWDEAHAFSLECVVRVSQSSEIERSLHYFDPEVFLLVRSRGRGR